MTHMIHIGRKVPKGFVEKPGAIHLGHGIWMFPVEPVKAKGAATMVLADEAESRIATLTAALKEAEEAMEEAKRCFCGCDICGRSIPVINTTLTHIREAMKE